MPSETVIVALGVATAESNDPRLFAVVGLAALGAFSGDNFSYLLGNRFGPLAERRFFSSPKGIIRRAWALRSLEHFGGRLIVVCRFIPGGRTAVTLTCGIISYARMRFVAATAVAGVIWASYAFLVGRLGGRVVGDKPWVGFLVGLGIVLGISLLVEAVRRIIRLFARKKDRTRLSPDQAESFEEPDEPTGTSSPPASPTERVGLGRDDS